ncbi:MAG TPA: hypothetical protein DEH02_03610 [Bacteroidales bacterium]|nr:MAG: hypothetical protein A2X01_14910 [Bacteroidetes bacterium GWF2_35_48]HBX50138.1 hypothetical protein [Bacteroidales bacterium]
MKINCYAERIKKDKTMLEKKGIDYSHLLSTIRDKMGNEITFKSGTNPDKDMFFVRRNPAGKALYKGRYLNQLKEGLHLTFDDKGSIPSMKYYNQDTETEIPKNIKIYMAVKNGDDFEVKKILSFNPDLMDLITPEELQGFPANDDEKLRAFSILELALKNDNKKIADFLIDVGAKLTDFEIKNVATDTIRKHDPLSFAIINYNNSLIDKIITKDPDVLKMHHRKLINDMKNTNEINIRGISNSLRIIKEENDKRLKM